MHRMMSCFDRFSHVAICMQCLGLIADSFLTFNERAPDLTVAWVTRRQVLLISLFNLTSLTSLECTYSVKSHIERQCATFPLHSHCQSATAADLVVFSCFQKLLLKPPARGRRRRKVIVHAFMRGGSTFFGEFFQQNAQALYFFEPLDPFYGSIYGTRQWILPQKIYWYGDGNSRLRCGLVTRNAKTSSN